MKKKMSKALTWDELATYYQEATNLKARIQPMEDVFAWAERQTDKFHVSIEGTIHKLN